MTGIDFDTGGVWFLFYFNNFDREDLKPWGREPAHMHTISSTQPQKVVLTAVLPLRSEAEVQADLHIRSACPLSFFLPDCPIQKLLQPTVPLRKKLLLPQKTHNPKNNNANPHAHNLKIKIKIVSFLEQSYSLNTVFLLF
jgi:hypothetical protein